MRTVNECMPVLMYNVAQFKMLKLSSKINLNKIKNKELTLDQHFYSKS